MTPQKSKKTFVLTVSKQFPKTHKKAGKTTYFVENISKLFSSECKKIHTIRSNYELWVKRAKEINEGRAVLSIRYWSDMPYRSKQIEICRLRRIGIEKLENPDNFVFAPIEGKPINWETVAKNDGLSFEDFCEWFKSRQKEPMAVIHFTDFRYNNISDYKCEICETSMTEEDHDFSDICGDCMESD